MIILTRLVTTFFELFNKDLGKEIKKNKNRFSKLCILHQDIIKLLTELDAEMRWFFAVSSSFFIFLLIFVLYWIIKTSKPLNTIYYILNHSHVLFQRCISFRFILNFAKHSLLFIVACPILKKDYKTDCRILP